MERRGVSLKLSVLAECLYPLTLKGRDNYPAPLLAETPSKALKRCSAPYLRKPRHLYDEGENLRITHFGCSM